LHKACFIPTKSALCKAVKRGHFIAWPALMQYAIKKHLKMTPAKAMVRMNQRRQHICSTSKESKMDVEDEVEVVTPISTGVETDLVYTIVIDKGQLYT
jgi:hypothetical protein